MSVILSSTLGLVFYKNAIKNIKNSKKIEMQTLAYETSNKIDRFLFERNADLSVLANSKILVMNEIPNIVKLDYLSNFVKAYKTYDNIDVIDINKNTILTTRKDNQKLPTKILNELNTNKTYISDIIYSENNDNYYLYFASPLYSENKKIIGYVIEEMNFYHINEIIEQVKLGESGYAILNQSKLSTDENIDLNIQTYDYNNKKYIRASSPILKYSTQINQWKVVVIQSYSEAYSIITVIQRYFFLVIIVSWILLYAFSLIISKQITKPIKTLVNRMSNITENNKKYKTSKITSNEVKRLTSYFDILLEELEFMMQRILEKSGETAYINEIRENVNLFFDNIPSGIITIDNKGNIASVNEVASNILEINSNKLLNRNLYSDKNIFNNNIDNFLIDSLESNVKINERICYLTLKSNELVPVIISTLRQTGLNNNLIGITVIIRDLKEKEKFKNSISRAKKLTKLGELSAGMAHEIRNPLASIKGYTQLIMSETENDNQMYSDLEIILTEIDRLDRILERFMNFANPNKPKYGTYSINKLIKETVKIIEHNFDKNKILIKYYLEDIDNIEFDYEQIKQVLINIILNSVQAMKNEGTIEISSMKFENSNLLEIQIKDDGDGINENILDKIFSPFFTTRKKGTGLGLAICSRIIENHKGVIEVESQLNCGTIFKIKIPTKKEVYNG